MGREGSFLIALHLGLHWGMFLNLGKKVLHIRQSSRARTWALRGISAVIAAYGLIVFVQRGLLTYMLLQTEFVFLDFGEAIPLFYLDYLAMTVCFVLLSYWVMRLLTGRQVNRSREKNKKSMNGGLV